MPIAKDRYLLGQPQPPELSSDIFYRRNIAECNVAKCERIVEYLVPVRFKPRDRYRSGKKKGGAGKLAMGNCNRWNGEERVREPGLASAFGKWKLNEIWWKIFAPALPTDVVQSDTCRPTLSDGRETRVVSVPIHPPLSSHFWHRIHFVGTTNPRHFRSRLPRPAGHLCRQSAQAFPGNWFLRNTKQPGIARGFVFRRGELAIFRSKPRSRIN